MQAIRGFLPPATAVHKQKQHRVGGHQLPKAAATSLCLRVGQKRPRTWATRSSASAEQLSSQTAQLPALQSTSPQPLQGDGQIPAAPGVYAVYDAQGTLQYIGLSRKVAASLASHLVSLPELAHSARWALVADASKENLTAAWKQWLQDAVQETGTIPPGNAKGNKQWTAKRVQSRPEIKLTPGKGVQDLTCSVTDLVDQVVRSTKAVAFVKGTRFQPQCGFSYKVLSMLTELRADFEVVNVLDDQFNPGVRDAIKEYSQWPTIPQVYVGGEFLGGADIVEEMHGKGELKAALQKAGACM